MKDLIQHKRAHFDYEILETFEAGIVLSGSETKSVRLGRCKLEGGHVVVRGGEAYLVGVSIAPYQTANTAKDYEPETPRKLLLSKKEIALILAQSEKRGLTVVPLTMYNNRRYIKVKIGIARGKKNYDKRDKIQERETDRTILRTLKNQKNT
ncbi:SsrA-binding protein SmpB [Patescibacteria group bacterium]|nr:SsrA-binding protein SmpB [Patescibacteria group bacterium]